MLWWTLRKLRSADPEIRNKAIDELLRRRDHSTISTWQPREAPFQVLRAILLRRWDSAVSLPLQGVEVWLPSIASAIERDPPDPFIGETESNHIEAFFAAFSYEDAVPYLFKVLDSDVRIATTELSRRMLREAAIIETVGDGGPRYAWEGEQEFVVRDLELSFESRNPIAEGASRALQAVARTNVALRSVIHDALTRARLRPQSSVTKLVSQREPTGPARLTAQYHDREGR